MYLGEQGRNYRFNKVEKEDIRDLRFIRQRNGNGEKSPNDICL